MVFLQQHLEFIKNDKIGIDDDLYDDEDDPCIKCWFRHTKFCWFLGCIKNKRG
jgi:hypothetical protein